MRERFCPPTRRGLGRARPGTRHANVCNIHNHIYIHTNINNHTHHTYRYVRVQHKFIQTRKSVRNVY